MTNSLMQAYKESAQQSLDQAQCLPLEAYHDRAVYQAETEQLFLNDWIFICTEDELSDSGSYFALEIAGEQLIVIRSSDGKLRALSNICRHRGTPLLDKGFGQISKNIVCPYHAWNFSDTGDFRGAPMPGRITIDKEKHRLPEFPLACWHGLIFINLSPNPQPFKDKTERIDHYLQVFEPDRFTHAYRLPTEHWQSNWKLAVENGIESYHLFKVHKETLETTTPTKQAYYVAGSSEWTLTGGAMKDTRSTISKWLSGSYPEAYNHYLLLFLPPSFIAVITYEGINWIRILPEGPEHCSVTPGGLLEHKIKDFSSPEFIFTNAFLAEDKAICERVQQGMHSRSGRGGKLVELEQILVDFRQYIGNRLFDTIPDYFRETGEADKFLADRG